MTLRPWGVCSMFRVAALPSCAAAAALLLLLEHRTTATVPQPAGTLQVPPLHHTHQRNAAAVRHRLDRQPAPIPLPPIFIQPRAGCWCWRGHVPSSGAASSCAFPLRCGACLPRGGWRSRTSLSIRCCHALDSACAISRLSRFEAARASRCCVLALGPVATLECATTSIQAAAKIQPSPLACRARLSRGRSESSKFQIARQSRPPTRPVQPRWSSPASVRRPLELWYPFDSCGYCNGKQCESY